MSMRRWVATGAAAVLTACAACASPAQPAPSGKSLRIGVDLPLSGPENRAAPTTNYFRLTATDDLQGAAAADYAYGTLHVLRAGVISDHEAYGQGLVSAFSARLSRLGGSVVGHLDVDTSGSVGVSAFLGRMK